MVCDSGDIASIGEALRRVHQILSSTGRATCPLCGLRNLDEAALRLHFTLAHACEPTNVKGHCPLCQQPPLPLALHLHNEHGPMESREPPPAPFPAFAWCVVQRARGDGRFLLVHEPAAIARGLPRYWLPAGRVDVGETLVDAARRECLEEAGLDVEPVGVLRVMAHARRGRDVPDVVRVALLCRPVEAWEASPAPLKAVPDWESCGAVWASAEELDALTDEHYRSPDPAELFPRVASGALRAASLETDAWAALERAIVSLTRGEAHAEESMRTAWPHVARVYAEQQAGA